MLNSGGSGLRLVCVSSLVALLIALPLPCYKWVLRQPLVHYPGLEGFLVGVFQMFQIMSIFLQLGPLVAGPGPWVESRRISKEIWFYVILSVGLWFSVTKPVVVSLLRVQSDRQMIWFLGMGVGMVVGAGVSVLCALLIIWCRHEENSGNRRT